MGTFPFQLCHSLISKILHSHDFKSAEGYKGQNVVVVGGSYSAEDVASQLYKFGAKNVYLAHRKADAEGKWKPTGYKWPEGMQEKPNLRGAKGSMATFEDDSQAEVDAIVLCTGYKHSFPFLHKDLMLHCENKLWIKQLHFSTISRQNPKLFFLGMENQFFTMNCFSSKARWVRDVIMGKINPEVPMVDGSGKELTDQDFQDLLDKVASTTDGQILQGKFTECMMVATGYAKEFIEPAKFTAHICQNFYEWEQNKKVNIMTFRDVPHVSGVTGNTAPKPAQGKEWLKNVEDTTDFYKSLHK